MSKQAELQSYVEDSHILNEQRTRVLNDIQIVTSKLNEYGHNLDLLNQQLGRLDCQIGIIEKAIKLTDK